MEFNGCPTPSIGMELELQLIDPDTFDLVDGILPLMAICPAQSAIKPEYCQCMVEINSQPCANIQELESDLTAIVNTLQGKCRDLGMAICGGGTHPFGNRPTNVTPLPRYLAQHEQGGYLADISITFALHIHVGMPSGDVAIAVMDKLKPYLPILLALSASSPFWWGYNTGYASYRQRFLASTRTYGIPPSFQNWQEFTRFFQSGRSAGMIDHIRDLHWDVRPHPDFGTIEVRVMDSQPTIKEAIALTALVHSLIVYLHHCCLGEEGGFMLSRQPWAFEKENYFRASQQGIDAIYIEDEAGHTRSLTAIGRDILGALKPTAADLGETKHLQFLEQRLAGEVSYLRQRRVWAQTGSLPAVVAALVEELQERGSEFFPLTRHPEKQAA